MNKANIQCIAAAILMALWIGLAEAAPPADTPVIQRAYLDAEITRQRQDIFDLTSRLQGLETKTKEMPDGALLATTAVIVERLEARLKAVERLASTAPPPSVSPAELNAFRSDLLALLNQGLTAPNPELAKLRDAVDRLTSRNSDLSAALDRITATPPGLGKDQVLAMIALESQKQTMAIASAQAMADESAREAKSSSSQVERLASKLSAFEKKLTSVTDSPVDAASAADLAMLRSQISSMVATTNNATAASMTDITAQINAISIAQAQINTKHDELVRSFDAAIKDLKSGDGSKAIKSEFLSNFETTNRSIQAAEKKLDDLADAVQKATSHQTESEKFEQSIQARLDALEKSLSKTQSEVTEKLSLAKSNTDNASLARIDDLTRSSEQMSLSLAAATLTSQKLQARVEALENPERTSSGGKPSSPLNSVPLPAETKPVTAGIEDPGPYLVFATTKEREQALAARDKVRPSWESPLSILLEDDGAGGAVFALYVGQFKTVDEARRMRSKAGKLAKIEFKIRDRSGKIW